MKYKFVPLAGSKREFVIELTIRKEQSPNLKNGFGQDTDYKILIQSGEYLNTTVPSRRNGPGKFMWSIARPRSSLDRVNRVPP